MHVMQVSTHHPDACPLFNKDTRKTLAELMQQLNPTLAKHGVRLVGSWVDQGAHTTYNVYETTSMDAFVAFLNDPTLAIWLNFNTVDNRIVNTLDEMQAMMAAL